MALVSVRKTLPLVLAATAEEARGILDASIQKNFQTGGRPAWTKTKRGGQVLRDTNRLSTGIVVRDERVSPTRFRVVARVNVKYGRIHNFGGTIVPKKAKFLSIPITKEAKKYSPRDYPGKLFPLKKNDKLYLAEKRGKSERVKVIYQLVKSVKIPARKFLMIQKQDESDIRNAFKSNVKVYFA